MDPYHAVNFLVEIDGLITGGFSKVDGLESAIETQDYVEGGRNDYVHKVLKGTTYVPLVLSHGITDVDTLWSWHERTRRGVIQRKNGTLMLLDARHMPVMWWNFAQALPVKWVGPSFDASSDATVGIERIELVHRGITKPIASQALGALRLAGKIAP
ncbi:MAG: phage tail protein [Deltaproteobacteria bacterium]|nr:phage tail protein [Deltaproteobacteria bacterium]MCW5803096.1 phage tail protein [Deltaproteobacteria bacterium]